MSSGGSEDTVRGAVEVVPDSDFTDARGGCCCCLGGGAAATGEAWELVTVAGVAGGGGAGVVSAFWCCDRRCGRRIFSRGIRSIIVGKERRSVGRTQEGERESKATATAKAKQETKK